MLRVQLSPRKAVYVELTEDTFPNKGGFYCQVFADENKEWRVDDFTINRKELHGSKERMKTALVVANFRVKNRYGSHFAF